MKIKKVRQKLRINKKRMGQIMGLSRPAIFRIEAGQQKETKQQIAHLKTISLLYEIFKYYCDDEDGVSWIPYAGPTNAEIKAAWEQIEAWIGNQKTKKPTTEIK